MCVDEVLAVGDIAFQKKCLGKMGDIAKEGRTVLFVSHNLNAIVRLCERTILLDNGHIVKEGDSHKVVSEYQRSGSGTKAERVWPDIRQAPGSDIIRLRALRIINQQGITSESIDIRQTVGIEMEFVVLKPGIILVPTYHIFNDEGIELFCLMDQDPHWKRKARDIGRYISTVWIPGNFLSEGEISVDTLVITPPRPVESDFYERYVVAFRVIDSFDGDGARGDYTNHMSGVIRPLLSWDTKYFIK
jgi:lipopolysaccharide transport system ATP-binding protein